MIEAFIFDWAGTMVDFGCCVPTRAMARAFEDAGIAVTERQIRQEMGKAKRAHIEAILAMPGVTEQWSDDDVTHLLDGMERHTRSEAATSAVPIEGALELVRFLTEKNIKIGTTTGYTKPIMDAVVPAAKKNGYAPSVMVCADDVPEGRPAPYMIWRALERLKVRTAPACVKVDDAPVGIRAGKNAGLVTIGLSASGNGVGLPRAEFDVLPPNDRDALVSASADQLRTAGADYVVETVADIPALFDDLEQCVAARLGKS